MTGMVSVLIKVRRPSVVTFHAGFKVLSHVLTKRGAQGFNKASEKITHMYRGL